MTISTDPALVVSPARSLLARVRAILLQPRAEWSVIAVEEATAASLFLGYIAPLAAIAPAAGLIGMSLFGIRLPFGPTYRVPLGSAITSAVAQYALGLIGVCVLALIIDGLAPTFGGERSRVQALKVAAYASTVSWVVGVVALVPGLSVLTILGLYSLYLIYVGLPVVMKAPPARALGYTAAVIASAIVLALASGVIAARFVAYPSFGSSLG